MKHHKLRYYACVAIAVLTLLVPFLIEVIPSRPVRYVSVHPASTIPPMMGFAANSVFNTGNADALDEFPGVGEVISRRIVEGRDILGGYRIPEDLLLVNGIGEVILKKIMNALPEALLQLSPPDE